MSNDCLSRILRNEYSSFLYICKVATCKRCIESLVIAPPVTSPALAALHGGNDHQFSHQQHVPGLCPLREVRCPAMLYVECGGQGLLERVYATSRFKQALFIGRVRNVLPHDVAHFMDRFG